MTASIKKWCFWIGMFLLVLETGQKAIKKESKTECPQDYYEDPIFGCACCRGICFPATKDECLGSGCHEDWLKGLKKDCTLNSSGPSANQNNVPELVHNGEKKYESKGQVEKNEGVKLVVVLVAIFAVIFIGIFLVIIIIAYKKRTSNPANEEIVNMDPLLQEDSNNNPPLNGNLSEGTGCSPTEAANSDKSAEENESQYNETDFTNSTKLACDHEVEIIDVKNQDLKSPYNETDFNNSTKLACDHEVEIVDVKNQDLKSPYNETDFNNSAKLAFDHEVQNIDLKNQDLKQTSC